MRSHHGGTSNRVQTNHIFENEASVGFSYDFFEAGIATGPGTWNSLIGDTLNVLRNQVGRPGGSASTIEVGFSPRRASQGP